LFQEKRAAAAKAQQLQQPQGVPGSAPASGAASPAMENTPSGGVDRASSEAVAVAAAAMAHTKSQGELLFSIAPVAPVTKLIDHSRGGCQQAHNMLMLAVRVLWVLAQVRMVSISQFSHALGRHAWLSF